LKRGLSPLRILGSSADSFTRPSLMRQVYRRPKKELEKQVAKYEQRKAAKKKRKS